MNNKNWDKITFGQKLNRIRMQGRHDADDGLELDDNPYDPRERTFTFRADDSCAQLRNKWFKTYPQFHEAWTEGWWEAQT